VSDDRRWVKPRLADCPPGTPGPYQRAVVILAQRRASQLGLVLPSITWRWVDGRRDPAMPRGTMYPADPDVFGPGGGVVIYVRTDMHEEDLARTVMHELRHAHDAEEIRMFSSTKEEFDRRADAFAACAMARWPRWS
jgi:hypothetical protein